MKSFSAIAFFACLAYASASVAVLPSAKIIQGPSTKTTVVGPDGSAISSVAPGGQIVQEESVGVVAETAPVVAAPAVAYSAPAVVSAPALSYAAKTVVAPSASVVSAYSAPVFSAYSAPAVAYSAPAVAYSAPSLVGAPLAYAAKSVVAPSASLLSAYSAPVVSGVVASSSFDTVVSGPSGTIATGKTVAAPVVSAW
ncbi:hypothetical protein GWI33_019156 [Rhynchophorus ferrugineus]|uniref:Uncharacterized protein n=1 Tax=Rhynchophorus ferrugineus TaxID=354439 RepID=A0A834HUL1_RHYFE|nr:hypothetical protein GWI33_019156 [Rhynchophorus ferrugineus]